MEKKVIEKAEKLHVNSRGLYTCWKVRANDNIYFLEEYPRKIREQYSDEFRRMIVNYHTAMGTKSPFPKYYFKDTLIFMEYVEGQTAREYFNAKEPNEVSKEFLFTLLEGIVQTIEFLNKKKLAHRKLTLDKIFIGEESQGAMKVKVTGAKYFRAFDAKYSEREKWLALPKGVEGEAATSERTNIASFGCFLSELLNALVKLKELNCEVIWILHLIDKLRKKCLDRSSNEGLRLENVKSEIEEIKKGNPKAESPDIEKDTLKKWPCYKGKRLMKESESNHLISIIDCDMNNQLEKRLEKFKEICNRKGSLISHLVNFFILRDEGKAVLIEKTIPDSFIPFGEFVENMTMDADSIRAVLKSLILVLREMKSAKLFFCKPSFSNLCISKNTRKTKSKKRNIYFAVNNPYTAPLLDEAAIARAFWEIVYSLPFRRMVEFKDNRPTEKPKSFKDMGKEWEDLLSRLAEGEHSLTRIRYLDFFMNKENKRKYGMYEIVRENSKRKMLGKGSFGEVYECQLRYGPPGRFAYKKIQGNPNLAKDEIRRHNDLKDCDYIVRLHDHFEKKSTYYLILEKFDNDLKKHIRSGKRFLPEDLKLIAKNVAMALKHMHDKNMEHRDVKIANIFISYDKSNEDIITEVKLGDLGTMGKTPYYEPSMDRDEKGKDIWAFGVTLFLVAAGKLDEETEKSINKADISAENVDRILGTRADEKLRRLIKNCLSIYSTPTINNILKEPYLK